MQYLAYVLGIFGLIAYLGVFSLKKRIKVLEEYLAKTKGSALYESRQSLLQLAKSCVGQKVSFTLKEDYEDSDIIMYGNTKHGSNTILDTDKDWLLIRVETPKETKEKLIRLEAVAGIQVL